jgi:hypothetical protein
VRMTTAAAAAAAVEDGEDKMNVASDEKTDGEGDSEATGQ